LVKPVYWLALIAIGFSVLLAGLTGFSWICSSAIQSNRVGLSMFTGLLITTVTQPFGVMPDFRCATSDTAIIVQRPSRRSTAFKNVMSSMLGAGHYFKVFRSVVGFVFILMVNNFARKQRPTQDLFHYAPMFSGFVLVENHVTFRDSLTALPTSPVSGALLRTKRSAALPNVVETCHKFFTTVLANLWNVIGAWHSATSIKYRSYGNAGPHERQEDYSISTSAASLVLTIIAQMDCFCYHKRLERYG
jgi:hypothetical protein